MRVTALAVLAATASVSAQSTIVFGNLGNDGLRNLSATNTDIGTEYDGIAVGFYTPLTTYYLQSVTLGLFYDNAVTSPITVSLYSGFENLVATSSSTIVGSGGKYTFDFNNIILNQDAWYTFQPQSGVSWYASSGFLAPSGQNDSFFGYENTYHLSEGDWYPAPFSYSISVDASTAIPEPSTYGLILGGLVLAGAALRRRKSV
jgi:hypothetical protein